MSLFSKQRRGNVLKVASFYLISAWLLLQIFDVIAPYLQLPLHIGTWVIAILAIGFVVVCAFAFVYEVSPQGIRPISKTAEVEGESFVNQGSTNKSKSQEISDRRKVFLRRKDDSSPDFTDIPVVPPSLKESILDSIKKLAILPFANLIDDPQTNFLGFALADQIIGSMAYSKDFLVRPSSSVRQYQNKTFDLQYIANKLKVSYLLAGHYLKEDETLRLNVELVDLKEEKMIWREAIEIQYQNIFELQDIVSQKVADGLKVHFSENERQRMKADTPSSSHIYDKYLRAVAQPHTINGHHAAIEQLNAVLKQDSKYPPIFIELGMRYLHVAQIGQNTAKAAKAGEQILLEALELKPDLLPVLANLAMFYTDSGRHQQAHEMLIKAIKLNPNDAGLHFSLSYHYRYIGFLEESDKEAKIALQIDPQNYHFRSSIVTSMFLGDYQEILTNFSLDIDSPFSLNYLGEVAFRAGQMDKARGYFEKVIEIKDEVSEFHFASAFIAYLDGDLDNAIAFNRDREAEAPADSEIFYEIARLYGLFGEVEDCARALKRSVEMGYVNSASMVKDIFLDPVREDKNIKKWLAKAASIHSNLRQQLSLDY